MSSIQGTLAEWRDRLRRKELTPAELVNLTADAIEADKTTNAYIPLTGRPPCGPQPRRT